MFSRASGVLVHVSSLPGDFGIGCFGEDTKRFIDFLSDAKCKYWQVLPFGPTDEWNSPYASISAFAGNRNFIDLQQLHDEGLLTNEELDSQKYANPYAAAYEFLGINRLNVLYKAYTRLNSEQKKAVKAFADENSHWLTDYALYIILKEANLGKEWYDWSDDLKLREPKALERVLDEQRDTVEFIEFIEYTFSKQWKKIKEYAKLKNVEIIGDLPMYVSVSSSDVWSNREQFDLDEDCKPKNVGGVPPDYFSEFGQKWGQALYKWEEMKKDGYSWWMKRLELSFDMFDIVRIDHFRAFSAFWSIPAEAETAKEGEWIDGPKMDFFKPVLERFGESRIIAEDLGIIDDEVVKLVKQTGFPGMRIMQFGFMDSTDNLHLPHNYQKNCFAYTGTHDNSTLLGWLWEVSPEARAWALDYSGHDGTDWAEGGVRNTSCKAIIKTLWESHANVVIVPIQDLGGYGNDTKMNVPGIPAGNWAFRISREQLGLLDKDWLEKLNHIYKRIPVIKER